MIPSHNSSDTKSIPMVNEQATAFSGEIRINHSVVASIVRLASMEVSGVYSVGGSLVDGIAEIFSKKDTERGVKVTQDDLGHYQIEVRVVLRFGIELARVAAQIQENVRSQVSRMTMNEVSRVDVTIDGVKMDDSSRSTSKYEPDIASD